MAGEAHVTEAGHWPPGNACQGPPQLEPIEASHNCGRKQAFRAAASRRGAWRPAAPRLH